MNGVDTALDRLNDRNDVLGAFGIRDRDLETQRAGRRLDDALGAPIDERQDTDEGVLIRAKLSHRDARRFARYLIAGDDLETAATT